MKVYVVSWEDDGNRILGVFSNQQLAKNYIKGMPGLYFIDEFTVNSPAMEGNHVTTESD